MPRSYEWDWVWDGNICVPGRLIALRGNGNCLMAMVSDHAHLAPSPLSIGAYLEKRCSGYQETFGAISMTEKVSGAHVEVSGAHFKVLAIIKSLRSTFESLLKVSGAQFNEIMSRIEALFLVNTCNNCPD